MLRKQFQEAFETIAQIKEGLKRTEFDVALHKKSKLLFSPNAEIDRGNDPSKQKWGSPNVQDVANGHLAYHCSFYCLALAIMYDVTCEFCCVPTVNSDAQKKISANVLESTRNNFVAIANFSALFNFFDFYFF